MPRCEGNLQGKGWQRGTAGAFPFRGRREKAKGVVLFSDCSVPCKLRPAELYSQCLLLCLQSWFEMFLPFLSLHFPSCSRFPCLGQYGLCEAVTGTKLKLALSACDDFGCFLFFFCDSDEIYLASMAPGSGTVMKSKSAPWMLLPRQQHQSQIFNMQHLSLQTLVWASRCKK